MPTYQYECGECGAICDVFQSILSEALEECPECKENKLRRVIKPSGGFILKGTGYYATDFKNPPIKSEKKEKQGSEIKTEPTTVNTSSDKSRDKS